MIKPYYEDEKITLYHASSEDVLPQLSNIHACVTDPPYGLSFMGKKWDYDVPTVELWKGVLNALLPGAHLLSFAGTRTQHRMAVRIEDGGFEIRDMIAWVYGSGFPKSLNVGKAFDSLHGNKREIIGTISSQDITSGGLVHKEYSRVQVNVTKGTSEWEGYGTALKPALEPITLARKPIEGTIAQNVLKHGTGGMNIDGCRVGTKDYVSNHSRGVESAITKGKYGDSSTQETHQTSGQALGRFPANLIHDGSDEVLECFPVTQPSKGRYVRKTGSVQFLGQLGDGDTNDPDGLCDSGSAARFFYCAKASKTDREEGNKHPTVKPTDLMRYLCRLVAPKNGIILDPFMGSGSTGKAAVLEGFRFIGIERDEESCKIALGRILSAKSEPTQSTLSL